MGDATSARQPLSGTEIAAPLPRPRGWTRGPGPEPTEGGMGLFGRHDYGRDYRGEGRGFGDRLRGAWNRFENPMEGGMPRGYDRGMRGGGGYGASDFAYRGLEGAWSTARNR